MEEYKLSLGKSEDGMVKAGLYTGNMFPIQFWIEKEDYINIKNMEESTEMEKILKSAIINADIDYKFIH